MRRESCKRWREPAACARTPDRAHASFSFQLDKRTLYRALAGAKRERKGRRGPRSTIGEQREKRRLIAIDGRQQDDDLALAARRERGSSSNERKASRAGADVGERCHE